MASNESDNYRSVLNLPLRRNFQYVINFMLKKLFIKFQEVNRDQINPEKLNVFFHDVNIFTEFQNLLNDNRIFQKSPP